MQCSIVLAQVRYALNDPSAATWTDSTHLIPALNDALRALVSVRPDAASSTEVKLLTAGTRQTIPTDGVRLIDVIRNAGEDGLSSTGRTVRRVSLDALNASMPTWHAATGQTEIREYAYDERSPREFWVYPPVASSPTIGVLLTHVRSWPPYPRRPIRSRWTTSLPQPSRPSCCTGCGVAMTSQARTTRLHRLNFRPSRIFLA